jgi:hypothetical protein
LDTPEDTVKRFRATILACLLGVLVAFVLLMPSHGIDSDPPECYSYLGYVVPCGFGPEQEFGSGFAAAGAAVAALLVAGGAVAGRRDRDRN